MPKTNAAYTANIRAKILDAAYAVCMSKPLHEVSMRDIISKVGFSQGNIYRYFSNLDDIIIELFNSRYIPLDRAAVEAATKSEDAPENVIGKMFRICMDTILESLFGVGKIYYEISAIYVNDSERLLNFCSKVRITEDERYFWKATVAFVNKNVADGYFQPVLPLDDIFNYLVCSVDGIIRDFILATHYKNHIAGPSFLVEPRKEKLINSLHVSFVGLLSGNTNICFRSLSEEKGEQT